MRRFLKGEIMAKVYLVAGRICAGKTTFAHKICMEKHAALLSTDEITLAIFGQHIGEKHDEVVEKTQEYLFQKSLELIACGISVCLDWGFWQRDERDCAREFYKCRGIETEFYYVDIPEDEWKKRIQKRNGEIGRNETQAYFVDENLRVKFGAMFEKPDADEDLIRVH